MCISILFIFFDTILERTIQPISNSQTALEGAGASIMKREQLTLIGEQIIQTSIAFDQLSMVLNELAQLYDATDTSKSNDEKCMQMASQRILFASMKMKEAGEALVQTSAPKTKPKGKGWIKGGF